MTHLRLNNISKRYGANAIITDLNLTVGKGELCVFVGPSGCGKSTLLKLIAGLEAVSSGEILFDDIDVTFLKPVDRRISMVFQSYALYPHMTVAENIAFPLKVAGMDKTSRMKAVVDVIDSLRILELKDRLPKQLSGGQRQRVAIGRALVRKPSIFLLDEPLSNLDAELRVDMRYEIAQLHQRLTTTMIYVTHDQVEAMTLADKIVVLNKGRIEQAGSPMELYHNPINMFVAGFIGLPKMNFFPVQHDQGQLIFKGMNPFSSQLSVDIPYQGQELFMGIRPDKLRYKKDENGVRVSLVENLGSHQLCHVEISQEQTITIQTNMSNPLDVGEKILIDADQRDLFLFDLDGQRIGYVPQVDQT